MASQVMRITLKAYDHQLVDTSAAKIIETVKKNGSKVSGPVPLPTKKEVVTILRAVHKYKDSREQFEQRTHKRLIDIIAPSQKTVDAVSYTHLVVLVPEYIDAEKLKIMENYAESCLRFEKVKCDERGLIDLSDLKEKAGADTVGIYFENPGYLGVICLLYTSRCV